MGENNIIYSYQNNFENINHDEQLYDSWPGVAPRTVIDSAEKKISV